VRLDARNTAIVLDSTADFPEGPERFPNWRIVPLYVRFGDESHRDYVDLPPYELYRRLRTAAATPTTSQPSPGDFLAVYEELGAFERILSLHISAKLSGTYESARRAGEAIGGGRVRAVDTGTASAAIALLALAIQRRLELGTTDDEVDGLIDRYRSDAGLVFTVETLEYLVRGGRIGPARAWAGQLLDVRPILTIAGGEVLPVKRVRGNRKAFQAFVDALEGGSRDSAALRVAIAHADAPERELALRELVRRTRPQARLEVVTTLGAVLGVHAGPGTVGLFWFEDPGG